MFHAVISITNSVVPNAAPTHRPPGAAPCTPPTFVMLDFETADYGRQLELRYSDRSQRQNAVRKYCAIRGAHCKPHLRDCIVHANLQHVSSGWHIRQAVRTYDAHSLPHQPPNRNLLRYWHTYKRILLTCLATQVAHKLLVPFHKLARTKTFPGAG